MTSRLLVADDSITIQKIVSMAFEIEDVEVEGIGNGQEAFDRISQFNPDIVLADVDMPGLDGFELSAKIKESPETSSIKVLLLASDFEEFDEQRYQNCGADNHISKPFKSDDIVAMVKSLLQTSSGDEGAVMLSGADLVEEEPQEE
jgi:CheY-like chemotaxis protein